MSHLRLVAGLKRYVHHFVAVQCKHTVTEFYSSYDIVYVLIYHYILQRCMDGCHFNNDCSQDTACLNQTCQDPCHPNGADGSVFDECGVNAVCQVISHAPTCKCPEGFRPLNSPYVACVPLGMDLEEITCLKVRLLDY